jgi:hypothetical protein
MLNSSNSGGYSETISESSLVGCARTDGDFVKAASLSLNDFGTGGDFALVTGGTAAATFGDTVAATLGDTAGDFVDVLEGLTAGREVAVALVGGAAASLVFSSWIAFNSEPTRATSVSTLATFPST